MGPTERVVNMFYVKNLIDIGLLLLPLFRYTSTLLFELEYLFRN